MNFETILANVENGIFMLTINRPDKLNALNQKVFEELNLAMDEVERNSEVRSVLITGAGAKSFVAGADITEFNSLTKQGAMDLSARGQATFARLEHSSKPVVAAVNGFALGGGCELAMSCHFRLASDHAKFGQPEVNLGLVPGYGGTQRLVQLIGKGKAMELLMTAGMLNAQEALSLGLVNYVTTPEELLPKAKELLQLINSKAPRAVAGCIKAANAVFDEKANGYAEEVAAFGESFDTEDRVEGTTAFLEKRKAEFRNK